MLKSRSATYILLTILLALIAFSVAARFFPVVDLVASAQERVLRWGPWGAIAYPFLFALCNLLLLPGSIVCIGAGLFFGLWWGLLIVFVGNAVSAAISFALSRWLAGDWLRNKLVRNRTVQILEPAVAREGWKIIFLSQLHPLFPASLLNYFYGLTTIRFRTFMFWVSIGRVPGLFLYVYLGTLGQFGINMLRGKSHPRVIEYWTWGGAFVISVILFVVISRIALRAIHTAHLASNPAIQREIDSAAALH